MSVGSDGLNFAFSFFVLGGVGHGGILMTPPNT